MRRFWAALGSLLFFVIAPGTILGLVPWSITDWQLRPAFFGFEALRLAGAALVLLGLILLRRVFRALRVEGLWNARTDRAAQKARHDRFLPARTQSDLCRPCYDRLR